MDGGADRIRTCDLLIANETLYQLSYDPIHADGDSVGTEPFPAQLRTMFVIRENIARGEPNLHMTAAGNWNP